MWVSMHKNLDQCHFRFLKYSLHKSLWPIAFYSIHLISWTMLTTTAGPLRLFLHFINAAQNSFIYFFKLRRLSSKILKVTFAPLTSKHACFASEESDIIRCAQLPSPPPLPANWCRLWQSESSQITHHFGHCRLDDHYAAACDYHDSAAAVAFGCCVVAGAAAYFRCGVVDACSCRHPRKTSSRERNQ